MNDAEIQNLNNELEVALLGTTVLETKSLYALKSYIDQRFEILERKISLLSEDNDFPDGYMP